MLHRHVVNEFLNKNRFADSGAAEQPNLSALQKGLDQIDHLDARLEHFQRCGLLVQQGSRAVNLVHGRAGERPQLVHGFAKNIHHASECRTPDGNADAFAEILRLHAAH